MYIFTLHFDLMPVDILWLTSATFYPKLWPHQSSDGEHGGEIWPRNSLIKFLWEAIAFIRPATLVTF